MMSATRLLSLEHTIQKMNLWLDDLLRELKWNDRQNAYQAFRAVLQTLRDHLPLNESAQFAAQLPQIFRGMYYEDWQPGTTRGKKRHWGQFVEQVWNNFALEVDAEPEQITCAVFKVIGQHVSTGEVADVKHCLPEEIRRHWQ